jgi:Bacterial PH domain
LTKLEKLYDQARKHIDLTNETVVCKIMGTYDVKVMGKVTLRYGVFIATDKRLVFFAKKMFGYDFESFPLKNISSCEGSKGALGYAVSIHTTGNSFQIKYIKKNMGNVLQFITYIQEQIQN